MPTGQLAMTGAVRVALAVPGQDGVDKEPQVGKVQPAHRKAELPLLRMGRERNSPTLRTNAV